MRYVNYPLLIGGAVTLAVALLAIIGPSIAPHDPMLGNVTVRVDGRIVVTPFGPFEVPGYPLGTDEVGRDVLSRILWGIRPTLILCLSIVAARLVVGVLLGLLAGWFRGGIERVVDAFSGFSLGFPLLAFAAAAIIVIGIGRGLLAFVIALSLTGWVEVAGLVKARVGTIRTAPYIESARAVGIGTGGILWRHVLPQVMILLPMLLAFELSTVLLLVTELGFLGIFIGGAFTYENANEATMLTAGYPELGQQISQFWRKFYRVPWEFLTVGLLILTQIVGYNLLGEGLRRRLDVTRPRRMSHLARLRDSLAGAGESLVRTSRAIPVRALALSAATIIVGVAYTQLSRPAIPMEAQAIVVEVSTTPRPVEELAQLDLESLAYQEGDLPVGYTAVRFSPRPPRELRSGPEPVQAMNFGINRNGLNNGSAGVVLYPSLADRDAAFEAAITALPGRPLALPPLPDMAGSTPPDTSVPGLGDRAYVARDLVPLRDRIGIITRAVVFARCGAVAIAQIGVGSYVPDAPDSVPVVINYAQHLDSRLAPLVCE